MLPTHIFSYFQIWIFFSPFPLSLMLLASHLIFPYKKLVFHSYINFIFLVSFFSRLQIMHVSSSFFDNNIVWKQAENINQRNLNIFGFSELPEGINYFITKQQRLLDIANNSCENLLIVHGTELHYRLSWILEIWPGTAYGYVCQ